MSGESEERLKKLVDKCVNSAELDEASMKTVRSLCRKDDSCIAIVVAELLWFLKRKHCVVRFEITEHFQKRKVVELEKEYFLCQVAVLTACRLAVSKVSCVQGPPSQGLTES